MSAPFTPSAHNKVPKFSILSWCIVKVVQPCSLFSSNSHTHTHACMHAHTHAHTLCEQGQDCQCADTPYNQLQCCELVKVYLIPVINTKKVPKLSESACTSVNLMVINFPWSYCLFLRYISAGCSQCCLLIFLIFPDYDNCYRWLLCLSECPSIKSRLSVCNNDVLCILEKKN